MLGLFNNIFNTGYYHHYLIQMHWRNRTGLIPPADQSNTRTVVQNKKHEGLSAVRVQNRELVLKTEKLQQNVDKSLTETARTKVP